MVGRVVVTAARVVGGAVGGAVATGRVVTGMRIAVAGGRVGCGAARVVAGARVVTAGAAAVAVVVTTAVVVSELAADGTCTWVLPAPEHPAIPATRSAAASPIVAHRPVRDTPMNTGKTLPGIGIARRTLAGWIRRTR